MPLTLAAIKERFRRQIRKVVASRPDLSYAEIGVMFGVTSMTVWSVAREYGLRRKRGPKPTKQAAQQG